MADLLGLSARIIDSGVADEPVNRITQELSEVAEGIAVVESFGHIVALRSDGGLVVFDSSGSATGARVVESLRAWSTDPVNDLVYTHGHVDHVGGSPAFVADAAERGHDRPRFIAHRAVQARLDRYRMTDGWNLAINARQFGWIRNFDLRIGAGEMDPNAGATAGANAGAAGARPAGRPKFLADDVADPDLTYRGTYQLNSGGLDITLHHSRGETDDHTWAWIPEHKAICCGDFLIWNFPNAGNPQKVQRYPLEWAAAMRQMAGLEPELLLPAHGLPIGGAARIQTVLAEVANVLEDLVQRTLALMNEGATLDDILHTVKVADATLAIPYLRPLYDEPEFVVRNIWRQYGGWWDANPARLKPPPDADLAQEVAALAGGPAALATRAGELAVAGDFRLACQLIEWAAQSADGDADAAIHEARAEIYDLRMRAESSLMAKGVFAGAAKQSRRRVT